MKWTINSYDQHAEVTAALNTLRLHYTTRMVSDTEDSEGDVVFGEQCRPKVEHVCQDVVFLEDSDGVYSVPWANRPVLEIRVIAQR